MTLYYGDILLFSSAMTSIWVCVCVCECIFFYVNHMGPFTKVASQYCRQSERQWLKITLFPSKSSSMEFNEGGKKVTHTHTLSIYSRLFSLYNHRHKYTFALTDTHCYVSRHTHGLNCTCTSTAHTHTHTNIAPQLLVCGAPSGTPLHRNVSAAGSWEKGV